MKRGRLAGAVAWAVAIVILATAMLAAANCWAGLVDCYSAACRVSAETDRGSGCVFEISQGRVFVLTNAHVVGRRQTVYCEFWRSGHQSQKLPARVVLRVKNDEVDAAVLAIDQRAFGGLPPAAIPVAPAGRRLRPGEMVQSVGCAGGAWATAWQGHVLGYGGNGDLLFVPPPAGGRSGSAIVDAAGRQIVGLLWGREDEQGRGRASSVQALYKYFGAKRSFQTRSEAQCPPGGCPPERFAPFRISPYRYQQDRRDAWQNEQIGRQQGQLNRLYPTLPPVQQQQPPPAPQVDLEPLENKLDAQTERLQQIVELLKQPELPEEPAPRPAPVVETPQTPAVDQAALKAAKEAKGEAEAVKEETGRLKQAVGGLHGLVEKLVGDREMLRERYETRVKKVRQELREELGREATKREQVRAYAKDLAREKLGQGTPALSLGKILGGALGLSAPLAAALAAGAWLVSRRAGRKLEAGEPLLVQSLFERLGDKLDALKDRIHQTPPEPAEKK